MNDFDCHQQLLSNTMDTSAINMDEADKCLKDVLSLVDFDCTKLLSVDLFKLPEEYIRDCLEIRCELCLLGGHVNVEMELQENPPESTDTEIANTLPQDEPRVRSRIFENFINKRRKYLRKKARRVPTDNPDDLPSDEYNSVLNEELDSGSESTYLSTKKKKKRLAYEVDLEWCPKSEYKNRSCSPKPKKTIKNLRVNTRRKRIESDSDTDSDSSFDYFDARYNTDDELPGPSQTETATPATDSPPATEENQNVRNSEVEKKGKKPMDINGCLDDDVVTKIMLEMEAFDKSNSKSCKTGSRESGKSDSKASTSSYKKRPVLRKRHPPFKITDEDLTPSLGHVQKTVKDMVNTVCFIENDRLGLVVKSKNKKCKWCATIFTSNGSDTMCAICKDTVKLNSKHSPKKLSKKAENKGLKLKGQKSKIKSQVLKILPKYDKQRLMYSDRKVSEKGYNHCKNVMTATPTDYPGLVKLTFSKNDDSRNVPSVSNEQRKKVIILNSNQSTGEKVKKKKLSSTDSKKPKAKKRKLSSTVTNDSETKDKSPLQPKKVKIVNKPGEKVSITSVDKGLFLIAFPDPDCELGSPLDRTTAQTASNLSNPKSCNLEGSATDNPQVLSNYIIPTVPTVFVANFTTQDTQNDDFHLDSVYYQNEITKAESRMPQHPGTQRPFNHTNSLPSMPSLEQLSNKAESSKTGILPHAYQNNSHSQQFSTTLISDSGNVIATLPQISSAMSISSSDYSSGSNLINMLSSLPAKPEKNESSFSASESNFVDLLNSSHLQSDPVPTSDSSFEAPDLNGDDSNHQNSNNDQESDCGKEPKYGLSEEESNIMKEILDQYSELKIPDFRDVNALSSKALHQYSNWDLDALTILAVLDLDLDGQQKPLSKLNTMVKSHVKACIDFYKSENINPKEKREKMKTLITNRNSAILATRYIKKFGTYTRVAESMLRKQTQIKIKKEHIEEEDNTRSSCQFANQPPPQLNADPFASQSQPQLSGDQFASQSPMLRASIIQNPTRRLSPLDKLQTQIETMSDISNLQPTGATAAMNFQQFAPQSLAVSITSRSDSMSESRETPSRGSGPRTPARPESAMSQNEEHVPNLAQVKRERFESENSLMSQCAFSGQTTPSSNMATASPSLSQMVSNTLPNPPPVSTGFSMPSMTQNINQRYHTVNNPNIVSSPQMQSNPYVTNYQMAGQQHSVPPPNVTVPFSNSSSMSNVILNIANRQLTTGIPMNQTVNNTNPNVVYKTNVLQNHRQFYVQPGMQRLVQQPPVSNMSQISIVGPAMAGTPNAVLMNRNTNQNIYTLQSQSSSQLPALPSYQQMPNPTPQVQPPANVPLPMQDNNRQLFEGTNVLQRNNPVLYKVRLRDPTKPQESIIVLLEPIKRGLDSTSLPTLNDVKKMA